jgi:HlyD family secretion protein
MPEQLFRASALERLSSPERLDSLMTVTTPRGWLALIAICLVLGGALVWGVVGRTHDTIDGTGIILRRGGMAQVQAVASGTISMLAVKAGDLITPGQVLAYLAQPELERNIAQSEARLKTLQAQGAESGELIKGGRELEIVSANEQQGQFGQAEKSLLQQLTYLRERLTAQEEAVRRGLISRDVAQATLHEIARTEDAIAGMETQRTQLTARIAALRSQATQGLFTIDNQIQAERQQLELLRLQHARTSVLQNLYGGGRVQEILAEAGDAVTFGQPLLSVDVPDQPLDCYVFIPLRGKQIEPGMSVNVVPAGLNWEEYGYMVGKVRSVSRVPLSPAAMNVYLRNSALVEQFTAQGATYLVYVDMELDPSTASGFKWTSRNGPQIEVNGGTLLEASITTRDQAPITLVLPALRRWLGV